MLYIQRIIELLVMFTEIKNIMKTFSQLLQNIRKTQTRLEILSKLIPNEKKKLEKCHSNNSNLLLLQNFQELSIVNQNKKHQLQKKLNLTTVPKQYLNHLLKINKKLYQLQVKNLQIVNEIYLYSVKQQNYFLIFN